MYKTKKNILTRLIMLQIYRNGQKNYKFAYERLLKMIVDIISFRRVMTVSVTISV